MLVRVRQRPWRVTRAGWIVIAVVAAGLLGVVLASGALRAVAALVLLASILLLGGSALSGGAGHAARGFGVRDRWPED